MRRVVVVLAAVLVGGGPVVAWGEAPLRVNAKPAKSASTLDRPVGELKMDKVSLEDALNFLRDSTDANMHVNWKALEAAGVTKEAPVSLRLTNVSLRKALNFVLSEVDGGATWYIDQGVIEVTTQQIADQHMYTRVYPVEDLVMEIPNYVGPQFSLQQASQGGGGQASGGQSPFQDTNQQQQQPEPRKTKAQRGQELVDLITQTIRPDVWKVNGGTATIAYYNGNLVVTAPRQVHEAISAGR